MKIKTLTNCAVSHPVENIVSYCLAAVAVMATIGLALGLIAFIRNEFF